MHLRLPDGLAEFGLPEHWAGGGYAVRIGVGDQLPFNSSRPGRGIEDSATATLAFDSSRQAVATAAFNNRRVAWRPQITIHAEGEPARIAWRSRRKWTSGRTKASAGRAA